MPAASRGRQADAAATFGWRNTFFAFHPTEKLQDNCQDATLCGGHIYHDGDTMCDAPIIETNAKHKAKDSVFTDLFTIPKYLLELYQMLHPEDKTTTEKDLKVITAKCILAEHIYADAQSDRRNASNLSGQMCSCRIFKTKGD